jgi:tetratricopeptide (TPR) repeat protein
VSSVEHRRRLKLASLALLLGAGATARAQDSDAIAAAEALFRDARELIEAGNYAQGCPKFEAALALHASASTQLNIARCRQQEGRIASAWAGYKRALVLNRETRGAERQRELEQIALAGIAELEPTLPRLRIELRERPDGLRIERGGRQLPLASLGESLPADPGTHTIVASAPGYRTLSRSALLEPGKTTTVEIALEPDPSVAVSPAPVVEPPAPADSGAAESPVPTWAWVAGGSGLLLVGAGVYFLIDDLNAIARLREHCDESGGRTTCEPGYDYQADNARKNRGFGLFLGLTAAGAIAITSSVIGIASSQQPASSALAPAPWLTSGGGGLGVAGVF